MDWHVERLETCTSTMDEARDRARAGAPDGTVVIAKTMSGGRGQHDRAWHAPEGGLYLSMVLRDLDDPRLLTLALGNAMADILEMAGTDPQLKWVNDVLVDGKKIAGILCEAESTGDGIDFIVAGIGFNLEGTTEDWPDGLDGEATTLFQAIGDTTCVADVEAPVLDALADWIGRLRAGRDDEIIEAFRRRDALAGKMVTVDDTTGTAEGITDDGALLVDGTAVSAGTVTIVD